MMSDALEDDWTIMRRWLPEDLQQRARTHGFARRTTGLQDAELWLRLILMHVSGGLSLEQTVLRAVELGWVDRLSAVALFKRLRKAQPWLGDLTAHLLQEQRQRLGQKAWSAPWQVRLVDASDIQEPGRTGTAWRLHYALRLPQMVCDHFELTDVTGGEKLGRFGFAPGELIVADRGYSHRAGVAQVLRQGAEVLVRWNPSAFPLEGRAGGVFDALRWLRSLPARGARHKTVWFTHQGERFALRLCAVRKSRVAAQRAQHKLRRKSRERHHEVQEDNLLYAQYVMVLCSVPAGRLKAAETLELYRGRWQVELAFKRLKSLLEAGHVPKTDESSARAWMQAKVLTALLLERTLWEGEFLSPWGYELT